MRQLDDLSGQTFGIWKVLGYDHTEFYGANMRHGISWYRCQCQRCGRVFLKARTNLVQGKNELHQGRCKK